MADKDESSVLLSLNELMGLEENRLADEESAKAASDKADDERKEAESQAKRLEEEKRLADAEEARRTEEQRRREEEARVEAVAQGELNRAKAEADNVARMGQLAQAQQHEQSLAAIKHDEGKKKLKMAVIATAALLILGGVGGGIAFSNSTAEAEKVKAAQEAQMQQQADEAEKNMRRLEALLSDSKNLGESQKAELQAELLKAKKAAAEGGGKDEKSTKSRRTGGSRPKTKKKKSAGPSCSPGDPMCGGL